jgi:putative hemolysin
MRNSMTLAAIAAMGFLGACVGGIDQPTGDDDSSDGTTDGSGGKTARQIFDSDVKPLLAKCSGDGCHTGPETTTVNKFLGDRGDTGYYDALINDRAIVGGFVPASAQLLTKGAHQGPAWAPAEATKITAWLNKEAQERGTPDPDPTPDPTQITNRTVRGAEMIFAGCMATVETLFTQTQAYQVANLQTQNNGRCNSCHSPGGAGGLWLGPTNTATQISTMFNKWQEEVFFTGVFQAQIQPTTPPVYKIAAAENKLCLKGTEKQNNLGSHPAFDCRQNNSTALNNLKNFITQVQTKVDAGGCGTPAFKPSTP